MKTKICCLYLLFLNIVLINIAIGQNANLNGDTVFVSAEEELQIKLPSDKIEYRWTSLNPAYTVSMGPNSLFVHAKTDSAKCSNLSIFEGPGPRNHNLVFCYQKQITKFIYDYSTTKKLQQRIKEIQDRDVQKIAAEKDPPPIDTVNDNVIKLLGEGDNAVKNGQLETAELKYERALQMQPGSERAVKGLVNVTKKKSEALRLKIDSIKSAANKAFLEKKYDVALTGYNTVISLDPNDLFSKEKINEIEKITNDQAATEKEKEKEIEIINKYNAIVEKADKALANKDYSAAKENYTQAAALKPNEEYPKSKLSEVTTLINNVTRTSEINKQYSLAVAKGKAAYDRKDYKTARSAYEEASALKPEQDDPKVKLELIDRQLAAEVKNAKYDSAMENGNLAIADNNPRLAFQYFRYALSLKPLEPLPLKQINYSRELIKKDSINQRSAVTRAQEEIRKIRFREGMYEYSKYEKAAQITDYEEELRCLKNFLNIVPDLGLDDYSYSEKINESIKKIQTIRDHLTKTKGRQYQPEAIPYLNRELEKKYENINFSAPPDDQTFEKLDSSQRSEVEQASKEVLKEKPRLALADSSGNVKVMCQGITFKGDKAFYKVLIQNDDAVEFLTGAMQVIVAKKDEVSKNNPFYITAFPIVLPGKEFAIVYAAKNMEVTDEQTVTFDLSDRLKTKSFHISIPGKIYNGEKKQNM